MFDGVTTEDVTAERTRRVMRRIFESRFLRGALFVGLGTTLGILVGGLWIRDQLLSDQCLPLEEPNLSLAEFADLKGRLNEYQGAPGPEAAMELSEEELSFVMSSHMNIKARLFFDDDGVRAYATMPASDGCYNVAFRGGLRVVDGVATLTPREVVIGDLDLSSWISGRGIEIRPEQLQGRASRMLANTRELEVEGDRAKLRLEDRAAVW